MRFRKLRIAWSVGCGILCVLLIVLWVRSYRWCDTVYCQIRSPPSFGVVSIQSRLFCGYEQRGSSGTVIGMNSVPLQNGPSEDDELPLKPTPLGFNSVSIPLARMIEVP